MAIFYDSDKNIFKLDTAKSSYIIKIAAEGYISHLYYGAYVSDNDLSYLLNPHMANASFSASIASPVKRGYSLDTHPQEFSCNGTGDFRVSALSIRGTSGNAATDIRYVSHKIYAGKPAIPGLPATYGECDTLEITAVDSLLGAEITLFYSVFSAYDAIARSTKVTNINADKTFDIERIFSGCYDFNTMDYDFVSLWGAWAKERHVTRTPLRHGIQSIASKRGSSSHSHNPFAALAASDSGEEYGDVFGFSFIYSGNFSMECEVDTFGYTRMLVGINPSDFAWKLEAGDTFYSPEAVSVYSNEGMGGMSRNFHKLYRYNLCRGDWKTKKRPILVNNWEGTYFNFDDDKLVAIAKDAADLGIEMLVMDDGWFGYRNDDHSSLGDWYVNENKLKGGLKSLVDRVNALGLKFGIWFEPEMISPDSDLYRAHPDWCIHVEGRERSIGRQQYVIDMSRQDVRDNIFEQMSAILSSANIEYVKWDFNRNITEAGSAILESGRQKEFFHRYVLGLYDLLERLLQAFPHLLLEGCSGGGGRFDAGMLYYSPQYWTSDNTDAIDRCFIQWGTSYVYPPSSMSAHVSASPNHQTGRVTSIKTRGDVAMAGAFGYELDLNKLSDDDKEVIKRQVSDYHKYYDVVQNGDYYRLINPFDTQTRCAWAYVSADKSQVLLTYVVIRTEFHKPVYIKLKGLDPSKKYKDQESGRIYSGDTLMNAGLNLSNSRGEWSATVVNLVAED
jgi:Alpha-galactosidase